MASVDSVSEGPTVVDGSALLIAGHPRATLQVIKVNVLKKLMVTPGVVF